MRIELGPRDEQRFTSVDPDERDYLSFLLSLALGVLAQRPNQIEALESGANALTALGYYQDGLLLDQRLAALRPGDSLVIYNLACSLALTGRADEALESLAEAITLGYTDARHMARDPDLQSLQDNHRFQILLKALQARRRGKAS